MASRSKKAAAALLTILAAVFFAVYFMQDGDAIKPLNATNGKAASGNIADAASIENSKKADLSDEPAIASTSSYQLPPIDRPIYETFDELKLASDNGEAKASCRLALELVRCQFSLKNDEKKLEAALSAASPPEASAETQDYRDRAALADLQIYQSCKKLAGKKPIDAIALLEQSAHQHQLDAMEVWANGMWIEARYGESTAYLQDPAFDRWRVSAVPMMHAAVRRGSLDAAAELWLAHKYDSGPLFRGLVRNDPKQAYIYLLLTGLVLNKPRSTPTDLTASEILFAQQTARKMFQESFGGISTNEKDITSARDSVFRGGNDQHDFCNRTR